jgi:hypothetical protein
MTTIADSGSSQYRRKQFAAHAFQPAGCMVATTAMAPLGM